MPPFRTTLILSVSMLALTACAGNEKPPAISYDNANGPSDRPIAPCGICRQSLQEFEQRTPGASLGRPADMPSWDLPVRDGGRRGRNGNERGANGAGAPAPAQPFPPPRAQTRA